MFYVLIDAGNDSGLSDAFKSFNDAASWANKLPGNIEFEILSAKEAKEFLEA